MSEPMKACSRCRKIKPLSEFPRNKIAKSGRGSRCNFCMSEILAAYKATPKGLSARKEAARKYRESEKGKAYYQAYRQSDHGRATRQAYDHSEKGREIERQMGTRKRARMRATSDGQLRLKAREVVNDAVIRGDIPKPDILLCAHCGSQAREYHHYLGYSQKHWLDVEPLCSKCHYAIHHAITSESPPSIP